MRIEFKLDCLRPISAAILVDRCKCDHCVANFAIELMMERIKVLEDNLHDAGLSAYIPAQKEFFS